MWGEAQSPVSQSDTSGVEHKWKCSWQRLAQLLPSSHCWVRVKPLDSTASLGLKATAPAYHQALPHPLIAAMCGKVQFPVGPHPHLGGVVEQWLYHLSAPGMEEKFLFSVAPSDIIPGKEELWVCHLLQPAAAGSPASHPVTETPRSWEGLTFVFS